MTYSKLKKFLALGAAATFFGSGCARANGAVPTLTVPGGSLAPTSSAPATIVGAPLGGNLNGEIDWSGDQAFVDMIKTTRGFYTLTGRKDAQGNQDHALTDANGWPAEDFSVHVYDRAVGLPLDAGVYHLSFTGSPDAQIDKGASGADVTLTKTGTDANGVTRYDVTVGTNCTTLEFNFHSTAGGVKALKVVRPGYDANKPPLFTKQFLSMLRASHPNLLRFMDWHCTNANLEEHWSERSLPTDATQTSVLTKYEKFGWDPNHLCITQKGITWEYCIALANQMNTDIWINVPSLADDDYVRHLAVLLKNQVNPTTHIWIEYSNEVWNDAFWQKEWNRNSTQAEVQAGSNISYDGSTDLNVLATRRVAKRTVQMTQIFQSVFGAAAINTRVRPVLAWQMGSSGTFKDMLTFVKQNYGAPSNYLYALSVAPYFGVNSRHADDLNNLTPSQVLDELQYSLTSLANSTAIDDTVALAVYYGLKMTAYEGGPDTYGPNNIVAKHTASLDPRMKGICTSYLNMWYAKGGSQFNWYTISATNFDTQYGTWGITDNVRDLNQPKMQALAAVGTANPPAITAGIPVPGEVDARAYAGNDPTRGRSLIVQYINDGTTFDYLIRAPQDGDYQLSVNASNDNTDARSLGVLSKDAVIATLSIPPTPNTYKPVDAAPAIIRLTGGLNALRLHAIGNRSYNLNSIKIAPVGAVLPTTLPFSNFYSFEPSVAVGVPYVNQFNLDEGVTVAATSDNQTLVPNASIKLDKGAYNDQWGNHFNWQLTVTPAAGQMGQANISMVLTSPTGVTRPLGFRLDVKAG